MRMHKDMRREWGRYLIKTKPFVGKVGDGDSVGHCGGVEVWRCDGVRKKGMEEAET
jgi:hypothetical protein